MKWKEGWGGGGGGGGGVSRHRYVPFPWNEEREVRGKGEVGEGGDRYSPGREGCFE